MTGDIEWVSEPHLVDYQAALSFMDRRVGDIRSGSAAERIWLVEHPPVYTAGTSADAADLLDPSRFPVVDGGRGGQYTYHGPGQRVGYVMLDLANRRRDVRLFVHAIEQWIADALRRFGVEAYAVEGRVGLWVRMGETEAKIAAIGIRIRRWVSFHGFAINVAPDLEHFNGIVPCGLSEFPVTSLSALGIGAGLKDVDASLKTTFPDFLGRLRD